MSGTITEGYFTEVAAEWNGTTPPTPVLLPIAAAKLRTARKIDGVSFDGTADIQHYGVCSTAAATQVKTVTITGVSLVVGAEVTVKFSSTNTATNPKLKVNDTDALFIYYGSGYIQARYLKANHVYRFVCEEVNSVKRWRIVGDIDTDTTYTPFTPETAQYADDQEDGLVPGPEYGERHKFLRGDGTWKFPNFFGVCQTAGNTAEKVVNTTSGGFVIEDGAEVTVIFDYKNTASNPTLSVDGSSAYDIVFNTHYTFADIMSAIPYRFVYYDGEFMLLGQDSNIWPDGEHPIIVNGELNSYYVPQSWLSGGIKFGGTFDVSASGGAHAIATPTEQARNQLNVSSGVTTIELVNSATDTTTDVPPKYGYASNADIYYICQTAGTVLGNTFAVGDWLLSDGNGWRKIETTNIPVFGGAPDAQGASGNNGLVPGPSSSDKNKFLSANGGWEYLNAANSSRVGGFKTGYTPSGDNYALGVDSNGKGYVTVPIKYERNTVKFYVGGNGSHDVLGGCLCAVDTAGSVRSLFYGSSNDYYPDNGVYLIGAKIYLTEASKGFASDALEKEREFVASGVFNLSAHPAYDENRTNIREGEPLFLRVVPDRGNGVFNMFSTLAGSLVTLSHLTTDSFYIYLGWMIENGYAMLEMGNPLYYCDKLGNLIDYPEYLDSFKKDLQEYKFTPNASGTALAFIDTIEQDTNGEITVTKKSIPVFSAESDEDENDGVNGLVPAPVFDEKNAFLRGDGTWAMPPTGQSYTAGDGIDITSNVIAAALKVWSTELDSVEFDSGRTTTLSPSSPNQISAVGLYKISAMFTLSTGNTGQYAKRAQVLLQAYANGSSVPFSLVNTYVTLPQAPNGGANVPCYFEGYIYLGSGVLIPSLTIIPDGYVFSNANPENYTNGRLTAQYIGVENIVNA